MADAISKATMLRFPAYLRYLKTEAGRGNKYISSAVIAEAMGLSAVAARKDLAGISSQPGKPGSGFEVSELIADIERRLGFRSRTNAAVVGAGRLGRAMLAYDGFEAYGIHVVAAFDVSPVVIGAADGKPIYPMERIFEVVRREDIRVGILTVSRENAQAATDDMIKAGIGAILSFVPAYVHVPDGVLIRYEDLAASLAGVCGGLLLSE